MGLQFVLLAAPLVFGQKQPFTVQSMLRLARISEPALSPNGRTIAFTVQTVDLEQNAKPKQIYLTPVDGGTRLYHFDGRPTESPIGVKRRFQIVS